MKQFAGRVAVITGGASGIGRALADRFAAEGMKIVLADVESGPLKQAEREMRAAGHDVYAVRTDVSKASSVAALARKAIKRFGVVHILCNNAGVNPDRSKAPWESSLEDWTWGVDVNLWGVVHGVRSFLPHMIEHGEEGYIVNTASVVGLVGGSGSAIYAVTKHAIVRLTESIYASLRERNANIGVSVLCPGIVATGIYNSERNRPKSRSNEVGDAASVPNALYKDLYRRAMTPSQVAQQVIDGIKEQKLYLVTTHTFDGAVRERMEAILERRNPEFPNLTELSKLDAGMN